MVSIAQVKIGVVHFHNKRQLTDDEDAVATP